MKKVKVVIGANYGDEGKGNTVNHITDNGCAVVRFNGGAQAGHTVEHDGVRHVFHSLGSATMKGVPTILGPKFAVDPISFFREVDDLRKKMGNNFKKLDIYADPNCSIVTPFDIILNQAIERKRNNKRHGSCGMGFGETVRRNCHREFSFKLRDVTTRSVGELYHYVEVAYFENRVNELDLDVSGFNDLGFRKLFFSELADFMKYVNIVEFSEVKNKFDLVFEGAQGLCLDQDSPDFPHVTYSNTGLDNVLALLDPSEHELEVHYITRPYLTRHGAGYLPNEYDEQLNIADDTNKPNEYQGSLRFAPLNFCRMRQDIKNDLDKAEKAGFNCSFKLMISCCDQIRDFSFIDDEVFIDNIVRSTGFNNYETCWGPDGLWR